MQLGDQSWREYAISGRMGVKVESLTMKIKAKINVFSQPMRGYMLIF